MAYLRAEAAAWVWRGELLRAASNATATATATATAGATETAGDHVQLNRRVR
jgi:hypothetical protein